MGRKHTEQRRRDNSTSGQGLGIPTVCFSVLAVASFLLWEPSSSSLRLRSVFVGLGEGEGLKGRGYWEYYLRVPILKFLFFKFFPHFE